LIAPPRDGGSLATRTFIPHKCHPAIGVLGAVTVGTACVLPGSVTTGIVSVPNGAVQRLSVEHPTGELSVELELAGADGAAPKVVRASLIRTARALFRGEILIPSAVWDGASSRLIDSNARAITHA
jgi:4-oxalomesaconate tautomerase